MTTTTGPNQEKNLSLVGSTRVTTTPKVRAALREMEAISSDLCIEVDLIRGVCKTLSIFSQAEELEGLSFKDIGKTAMLMVQKLDDIYEGLEKIEHLAVKGA